MKHAYPILLASYAFCAEAPIPPVPDKQPEPPFATTPSVEFRMLAPGFVVRELPVKLTSLNNIEYSADGRLFAGGYDGRFHVLRDLDGDGFEERVDTFSAKESANYPLGMAIKDGDLYAVLTTKSSAGGTRIRMASLTNGPPSPKGLMTRNSSPPPTSTTGAWTARWRSPSDRTARCT